MTFRLHVFFIVATLILLGTVPTGSFGQTRDNDIQYRLAQSYERSGDYESAAKIYEQILQKNPASMYIVDALRRTYLQLKRYDDAITLSNRALGQHGDSLDIYSTLGTIYTLKSDLKNAEAAWDRAIAVAPKAEMTYRIVGNVITQSRLFDRAIALYQHARTALNNPMIFTPEIAYLYGIQLRYSEATKEYLTLLNQSPSQLPFVQSRIGTYTIRRDGLNAATLVVEQAAQADLKSVPLRQLLAWLYMEGKNYDRAYEVYTRLDESTNANGREVFNFAQRALNDHAYSAASKAFQEIVIQHPHFDQAPLAKFGYARTLEAANDEGDTLHLFGSVSPFTSRPESELQRVFGNTVTAYNDVISSYPGTDVAARSLLRLAVIQQERFFDLNGSRAALEKLIAGYKQYPQIVMEAQLRLGDIYLEQGNLPSAQQEFLALAGTGPVFTGETREVAAFRLAELDYFQQRFKDAQEKLKLLTTNPASDEANDALSLQIFIQDNIQPSDSALKEYARAALLARQHKLSEALERFEMIVKTFPTSNVVDEALIELGDVYTQMNKFPDAIASYERLEKDFPESIYLDRTLMKIAQVYDRGLKNIPSAIANYQHVLEKFPNSIYAGEARRRVRELRGDTL